jgi:hypothetical protein
MDARADRQHRCRHLSVTTIRIIKAAATARSRAPAM